MLTAWQAISFLLVGAFWGCTNPLLKRGSKGVESIKADSAAKREAVAPPFSHVTKRNHTTLHGICGCVTLHNTLLQRLASCRSAEDGDDAIAAVPFVIHILQCSPIVIGRLPLTIITPCHTRLQSGWRSSCSSSPDGSISCLLPSTSAAHWSTTSPSEVPVCIHTSTQHTDMLEHVIHVTMQADGIRGSKTPDDDVSDISMAVPISNSTTFMWTALTEILLGEEPGNKWTLLGSALVVMGVALCVYSKLAVPS
jgi:hypothetical protein